MGREHKHRICTYEEAEKAIRSHEAIYVNACFCRTPARDGETSWEYCGHPIETCMGFDKSATQEFGVPYREITQDAALVLFDSWRGQGHLFRFMEDEKWVCFCCECGCHWFRDKEGNRIPDTCDPSPYMEKTDLQACNVCGACVQVCPTDARTIEDEAVSVDSHKCYGCSACEYACPERAVDMISR